MPLSTPTPRSRRIATAAVGATGATALVLGAVALAVPATTASAAPSRSSAVTAASCTDGSGTTWKLKATWAGAYRAKAKHGSTSKIKIVSLRWTTPKRGTIATAVSVAVTDGNGNAVGTTRHRGKSNYQHGRAALQLNPVDPPADNAPATITVTIGRTGATPCAVTFTQPMPKPKTHGHGKPTSAPSAGSDDTPSASSSPSDDSGADQG